MKWTLLGLGFGLLMGCGETDVSRLAPASAPEVPPLVVPPAAPTVCDLKVPGDQVVVGMVTGEYGCSQDLILISADGSAFLAWTFGEDRSSFDRCTFISNVEMVPVGGHLLAHRGRDGAVLFDGRGQILKEAGGRGAARGQRPGAGWTTRP